MPERRPRVTPTPQPKTTALWRDPWAWASLIGVLPLLLHSGGAHLGEPVAEDFDFLHRALLEGGGTLLDGGGSSAFWRPLAHQIYYQTLGPLCLSHPRALASVHAVLLALAALMLYRVLRRSWPGYAAAAAATFPLLSESTRTLISWPSHFVDLGLFLFSVLALHEATHRRLMTALLALLAALLCKELAVVTAALLPWMPALDPLERKTRWRWVLATSALVMVWAMAYVLIRRHFGLALPHDLETELTGSSISLLGRFSWAAWNSVRAIFSLKLIPGRWDVPIGTAAMALGLVAILWLLARTLGRASSRGGPESSRGRVPAIDRARPGAGHGSDARLAGAGRWAAWGAILFLGASATLIAIFPIWAPNRSQFGSVGLGIALVAALGSAHPSLVAALVGLRLVAFALAPGPAMSVSATPPETGAFMDFERLTRLQRLMAETREVLTVRFPELPSGAGVVQHHLPLMTEYAFGGQRALHVWYRDTTLRWIRFEHLAARPELPVTTIVEFQPAEGARERRQIVLVEPAAMRRLLEATRYLDTSNCPRALAALDAADTLQPDQGARVFLSVVAAKRSLCLPDMGQNERAVEEARRSLALWSENDEGRFTLAEVWLAAGRLEEAQAQVDTLLARNPGNPGALDLGRRLQAARRRPPR